jgi:UDP-2,4-diacetamido-2,4,6-trideoxy-beta-L-altropyranose hydrolase
MTGPRILFVVDAGPRVGGGHVMRSLTLARALEQEGCETAFIGPPAIAVVLDAFAPQMRRLTAASSAPEDLAYAVGPEAFEAVVFDHYGLAEREHRAMGQGRPVLVIDDLADRPLGADVVLDSGPGRRAEDYSGLLPAEARLLLGPQFAPVRPEFAALRETALAWRGEPVQRILVAMGLTDLDGITGRIVERLRPRVGEAALDVVLGAAAVSLAPLSKLARRDTRLHLHVDTPHMARLVAEADIGVGAAGSSAWERCTLGLPTLQIVLADNQRASATVMAERGAVLSADLAAADFEVRFDRGLARLLRDGELRRSLARASAELCDGQGAQRTAHAFLSRIRSPAD